MEETLSRINKLISFSELKVVKALICELNGRDEAELINSKIADKAEVTRSVLVSGIRLIEVCWIITTRSMGAKGTYIKVIDREALERIARF